jgi:hypothetical protein
MFAKGNDTLLGNQCLDIEMRSPSHLVKASKRGRMLTPGNTFCPPKSHSRSSGRSGFRLGWRWMSSADVRFCGKGACQWRVPMVGRS